MCGIAGILGEVTDANRDALRRMNDALAHRGPDSEGYWTSSRDERGHGCMLAHRRLSIIDLSHAADQPMSDCTGGVTRTLIFNGEIYNFKDLRRELEARGERFESTGDTAVMLRLLALNGADAVRKLRGMFAFALWNEGTRDLVLARDPLGIKPLYVCRNPDTTGKWSLLFASEVRAILASGLIHRRLNRRALASAIWNGFVPAPATIVEGIESLRPGELRAVHADGGVKTSQYWRMPAPPQHGHIGEEELREALTESVRLHMVSDVPIGIFLSGGIDSSAIANLAQRTLSEPVHTFTLGFEEQQYDEGRYARQIARAIGSEHHDITLTEHQFASAVHTALDTLDQPTFDGLNSYYISKAVREAGLTVALVGTGGDELFGGYPSFRILPMLRRWAVVDRVVPLHARLAIARLCARILGSSRNGVVPPQTRWAKLPAMVRAQRDSIALYQLAYALFLPDFQAELLLDSDVVREMPTGLSHDWLRSLADETEGHSRLSATSIFEQRLFLGERLLRDTDAASMAVSLETRLPLVDSAVTEAVNRLPDADRFTPLGRKRILRRIGLSGLDPALFERPKSGFVLPFERWIRRSLGDAMDETMRDASLARAIGMDGDTVARLWGAFQDGAPGLYWSRVWILFVLIRWCHRHRVLL